MPDYLTETFLTITSSNVVLLRFLCIPFSALIVFAGQQELHLVCKKSASFIPKDSLMVAAHSDITSYRKPVNDKLSAFVYVCVLLLLMLFVVTVMVWRQCM